MIYISIIVFLIGFFIILYTYYDHTKRLLSPKTDSSIKGHIRQHILILNLFLGFLLTYLLIVYKLHTYNLEVIFQHIISLSFFTLGIFLSKIGIHLVKELKKDNKWTQ